MTVILGVHKTANNRYVIIRNTRVRLSGTCFVNSQSLAFLRTVRPSFARVTAVFVSTVFIRITRTRFAVVSPASTTPLAQRAATNGLAVDPNDRRRTRGLAKLRVSPYYARFRFVRCFSRFVLIVPLRPRNSKRDYAVVPFVAVDRFRSRELFVRAPVTDRERSAYYLPGDEEARWRGLGGPTTTHGV